MIYSKDLLLLVKVVLEEHDLIGQRVVPICSVMCTRTRDEVVVNLQQFQTLVYSYIHTVEEATENQTLPSAHA